MHELSIVSSLINLITNDAERKKIRKVISYRLVVGDQSSVDTRCLTFALENLTPGTVLEGAKCELVREKSEGKCKICANHFKPEPPFYSCPKCHGSSEFIKGRDIYIEYYEGE